MTYGRWIFGFIGGLMLIGCQPAPAPLVPTVPVVTVQATQGGEAVSVDSGASNDAGQVADAADAADAAAATEMIVPSDTPTATDAPAPTATPLPPHELTIEAMRAREYPGSDLVFEETLDSGANYGRFLVSYMSEGNKIYAMLTVPFGEKPATGWPVVIFNHGYIPPDVYRTTERYVAYVDSFAAHGYIVFKSDYRGHGFSEGDAAGGYGSPAYTVDVLNGLASVKRYPDADPNRIGMWGHSMGGYITLRAMVIRDDIKAGVIWGGVVASYPDMFEHWWGPRDQRQQAQGVTPEVFPGRRRWRQELLTTYGTPEENPEFWASISANTYVAELSGPIQLHHGGADEDVPLILSQLLYDEMIAAGIPGDIWIWDGDNHNISNYFGQAMQRSIQWFDEHVK